MLESSDSDTPLSLDTLSLEPLCVGLLQLTMLRRANFKDVTGMQELLAAHPLQELHLRSVFFPPSLTSSMQLASKTLRVVEIRPNLTFPTLSVANFPALQSLQIESLVLVQSSDISEKDTATVWP